jgi:hypothetical protein
MGMKDQIEYVVLCHDGTTTSVDTSKGTLRMTENGALKTSSKCLADEIEERYKGHIVVAPRPKRGTRTVFGSWPGMPWRTSKGAEDADSEFHQSVGS